MRVSVIIPVYNSSAFLEDCLLSVVKQSYSPYEIIPVDDCSTDSSWNILDRFSKEFTYIKPIKLQANSGAGAARNAGLDIAEGDLVAFIDSDDSWDEDKLKKQVSFMESNAKDFTYTDFKIYDESGQVNRVFESEDQASFKQTLKENTIGTSTVVIKRDLIGDTRFPSIKRRQDWAFWLLILRKETFAYRFSEALTNYRIHKNSLSKSHARLEQKLLMLIKYRWKVYGIVSVPWFTRLSYIWHFVFEAYKLKFKKLYRIISKTQGL